MNLPEFENLESLSVTIENQVAHIELSRPKTLNALIEAFWRELPMVVSTIDAQSAARVIVISSQGKHFTAGMDLSVFKNMGALFEGDPARQSEYLRRWVIKLQDALSSLEKVRIPVLAAIQGACVGGGVDMVCAADSRYCTRDAFFTIKETDLAITADIGTLQRLPHLIPQGLVRELAYTSRNFPADEALATGFVNRVFDTQEQMLTEVMAIAQKIASQSPVAVAGTKEMLNFSRDHSIEDSLRYMATWQAGMLRMNDLQEAMAATQEKRPAKFENLQPKVTDF